MEKIIYECDYCGADYFETKEEYLEHLKSHDNDVDIFKYKCKFDLENMIFSWVELSKIRVSIVKNNAFEVSKDDEGYRVCCLDDIDNEIINVDWYETCCYLRMHSKNNYNENEIKNIFTKKLCNLLITRIVRYTNFVKENESKTN